MWCRSVRLLVPCGVVWWPYVVSLCAVVGPLWRCLVVAVLAVVLSVWAYLALFRPYWGSCWHYVVSLCADVPHPVYSTGFIFPPSPRCTLEDLFPLPSPVYIRGFTPCTLEDVLPPTSPRCTLEDLLPPGVH